jgi:hypothetical protein
MKVIASLSSAIILSFTCTAQSFAITPSFQSLADQSLSNPSQPTLVAGFFDQVINPTNGGFRIRRQQQNGFNRQRRREDAALSREQRRERYRQRQLQWQAAAKARKERERIYFESLTPEQQKQYIAKKKAQQDAAATMMTTILLGGMMSGGGPAASSEPYEIKQYPNQPVPEPAPQPAPAPVINPFFDTTKGVGR